MDRQRYFEGIEQYRLLAKHEVGQNFLIDADVAARIVELCEIEDGDKVVEIGSGAGSLTFFLAQTKGLVDAIDIDEALVQKLQQDFGQTVNAQYGNGVKWDYSSYDVIVGNLPYYITSLLLERVLLRGVKAKKMVFMVQKEAGDRILAKIGSKDYGPLPILVSLCSDAKKAFVVRRGCFAPAPHIDSVVLTFSRHKKDIQKTEGIYNLAKSMFLQRRKTLFNNLKNYLRSADFCNEILAKTGLDGKLRPENLSPEDYQRLYEAIEIGRSH